MQRTARLRTNGDTDATFLHYVVAGASYAKYIKGVTTGSLVPHISKEQIQSYPFLLPPPTIQRQVAAVLSALDAKIDLNNRMNAELEALAKTIYDYWFVQFDFPDARGRPYKSSGGAMAWNDSLKREIPAGWGVGLVGDLLLKQPNAKKVPTAFVKEIGRIPVVDQGADFICGYTDDVDARIDIDTPHIVFGDHTRIVKLVCFSYARGADGTQVLIPNTTRVAPFCFFQAICKIDLSNYGYARHFKFLKDSLIVTPDHHVAIRYDEIVKQFFASIENGRRQNVELIQLRDWLLPLLMNGQVRVA